MEAHACPVVCVSPHSSQNCLRCAQFRLRAPPPNPTHSIHIPGSPHNKGKYILHEEKKKKAQQPLPSDEMCISSVTQIVYGVVMFACLALTVVALFTPGWRKFSGDVQTTLNTLQLPTQQGILPYACQLDSRQTTNPSSPLPTTNFNYCETWWQNLQSWEKAVLALMICAVVAELAALGWNAFTCCACCCKQYLIHPLTPLSVLVSAFLAATVIIYGINNKQFLDAFTADGVSKVVVQNEMGTEVGYSFWLTVAALVLAIVDTVIAVVTVFFGERMC